MLEQVGFGTAREIDWEFWKCTEEPDFGPGLPIKTLYLVGNLGSQDGKLKGQLAKLFGLILYKI